MINRPTYNEPGGASGDHNPPFASIRDALTNGANLLEALTGIRSQSAVEAKAVAQEIAELHNEGVADAVEAFTMLSNNGPMFFDLRPIFECALPHLNGQWGQISHVSFFLVALVPWQNHYVSNTLARVPRYEPWGRAKEGF